MIYVAIMCIIVQGVWMTRNYKLIELPEINNLFVDLSLDTFEKRYEFLKFIETPKPVDHRKYFSITTVSTPIDKSHTKF